MEGETAMRWTWAAILGLALLLSAAVANAEGRKTVQSQERRVAQRPKVDVRPIDEKNSEAAPFRIRKDSSTPKKAAAEPSAPSASPTPPAPAKTAEPAPSSPDKQPDASAPAVSKDATSDRTAKPDTSDAAEKVRRPTETGETSGNAVAAFWIVLPKAVKQGR